MIVTSPIQFLALAEQCDPEAGLSAVPRGVFLIEPSEFHVSTATAGDNEYMDISSGVDAERALAQHRQLQSVIRGLGLEVRCFPGDAAQPDGVFLNNAFATIPGNLIIGRMATEERQRETGRADVREYFSNEVGYHEQDLSGQDLVAELTGVMILDRSRRIGYCGMTQRVDPAGCEAMHSAFDNRLTFQFDLNPEEYHTNVVMSVLAGRACVMVPDAFADQEVPAAIAAAYPGRTLLLSAEEKRSFSGNCIALTDTDVLMSVAGAQGLSQANHRKLADWGFTLHTVELSELEKAGGSLRCLIAELF